MSPSQPYKASSSAGNVPTATRTLLLVDADPAVRQLEAEILSRQDYNVLQAQSAEEALRLARQANVSHLLITDFSTPQVDGLELSHRFRSFHPRTPVLMLPGSMPPLRDGTRDLEHVALLAKPFTVNEPLERVRTPLRATSLPIRTVVLRLTEEWQNDLYTMQFA